MSYEVEYYELPDGSRPAEEFILAQDVKMQAKIFMALELSLIHISEPTRPY